VAGNAENRYGAAKNSAGCNWISGNITVAAIASAVSSTIAIEPKFNLDTTRDGARFPLDGDIAALDPSKLRQGFDEGTNFSLLSSSGA
jgi:hypothetical protein